MTPRLALALLLPFAACALQWLLWDAYIKPYVWFLFFPAAFGSAWLAGPRGGLAATALGALLGWYVFLPPRCSLVLESWAAGASLALFVTLGALFTGVFVRLQDARRQSSTSEGPYRALLDNLPQIIWQKDRDSVYVRCNATYARALGVSPEKLRGRTDLDFYPPELAAKYRADDQRIMTAGQIETLEEEWLVDGETRVVHTTKVPLRDAAGAVTGTLGIAEDITERQRAKEEIRRQTELNQRYLDTVQTILVALDSEGRIVMINPKGCELLGYAAADLLGKNWFDTCLLQPEGRTEVFPVFRRIMAGELAAEEYHENPVRRRDGSRRLIAWHNAVLTDRRGAITGTLSSGEDITERKAAEAELKQRNEELERFDRAATGRELEMIRLKRQVNELAAELGRPAPYNLSFVDGMEQVAREKQP